MILPPFPTAPSLPCPTAGHSADAPDGFGMTGRHDDCHALRIGDLHVRARRDALDERERVAARNGDELRAVARGALRAVVPDDDGAVRAGRPSGSPGATGVWLTR